MAFERAPVFVLCGGRTGSTLLRVLLDAHPKLFCPSETNLSAVIAAVAMTHKLLAPDEEELDAAVVEGARRSIDRLMSLRVPSDERPVRWCDKSLTSWEHTEALLKVWPEAKFICLYRHVMDFIASAVDTAPWGFMGYGFPPYIARTPESFPFALAGYWVERARRMLAFTKEHPDITCEVRYEDLVSDPETVADGIWNFLELESVDELESKMFSPGRKHGASDYKLWNTRAVHDQSLGKGASVPVEAIPEVVCGEINEILLQLEYQPLTRAWGSYSANADPQIVSLAEGNGEGDDGQFGAQGEGEAVTPPNSEGGAAASPNSEALAERRGGRGHPSEKHDGFVDALVAVGAFERLVVGQQTELLIVDGVYVLHRQLLSPIDGREVTNEPALLVIAREALVKLLSNLADPSSLIRAGVIRAYADGKRIPLENFEDEDVGRLVDSIASLANGLMISVVPESELVNAAEHRAEQKIGRAQPRGRDSESCSSKVGRAAQRTDTG